MKTVEVIAHAVSITAAAFLVNAVLTHNGSKLKDRIATTNGTTFNNPGNIERRRLINGKWNRDLFRGETPDAGSSERFTSFRDMVMGYRAVARILKTKYDRGLITLRQMISDYTENQEDVPSYVEWVSTSAGIDGDTDMKQYSAEQWQAAVAAIGVFEQGQSWLAMHGNNFTWAAQGYTMA